MHRMRQSVVILVLCGLSLAECGLTLTGAICGGRTCKLTEFCSDFDRTCQPCATICDETSHNFDKVPCEKQCQDYLHDRVYVRKDGGGGGNEDLKSTVASLSRMITGTLIVVCLMLIVLFSFLSFQLYRWMEKKNITAASLKDKIFGKKDSNMPPEERSQNFPNSGNGKKGDLKLEMPDNNSRGSDHSPVTVTTSISRRPAEDSTLDYAYDNPAMSASR